LCSWFGPYLIITGLLLGASIPLTYYVLQWALERDTTWAKRHATSVLPWILLILICITLIGGFSASVPKESELSETDQNQCHSKATRLLGFLQDSRPSHNDTQTNTTVGIVTLQDALDVEKAAFISAGILALFIFILLILSSYHELVLKILGTTWNRNLTSNLIRRPGQRGMDDSSSGRRNSQDSVIGALSDGKELQTIVPQRLRDGTETVHIRVITRSGFPGTPDVVEVEDLVLAGLKPTHTVKDLEERIGLLPAINRDTYGSAPVYRLEFHGQQMDRDRRLNSYVGIFVKDTNYEQILVIRTPSGYSIN